MLYQIKNVVLSYPQLFVPKMPPNAKPGQKARYSCMILIPHDVDIKGLQEACYNLLLEKWGDKTQALVEAGMQNQPNGLRWPFRKDNVRRDGGKRYDETKYKCYITPWSESPPGMVDRYAGPDGKPLPITQASNDKFYAGCVVNVSVNPFVYDNQGNRGVNFGLGNLQFWADGERLDNRVSAQDEFQAEARPTADLGAVDNSNVVAGPGAGASRGSALNGLFN